MNGDGGVEAEVKMEEASEKVVFMWGYLPGAFSQGSPLLSPVVARLRAIVGGQWKDVCGGGCGFALAISDSGKLITWGSTDDVGQSYAASGMHGEIPEPFPLPTEASVVKAAAAWAHCVLVTENGEVYTWGWKECIPSSNVFGDPILVDKDVSRKQGTLLRNQVSSRSQGSRSSGETVSGIKDRGIIEETSKRRRIASKQPTEFPRSDDESLSAFPCLVTLNPGIRVVNVAAGGRHTLALSDVGQVWGWGYGGEGQLGLGSRIRMVSSAHPVPCINSSSYSNDGSSALYQGSMSSEGQGLRVPGSYVKAIACGGRHSAVITDLGAMLTFGWGLYGQCGQGSTDDELSPTCVSSLLGVRVEGVAAGLWHTVCISADGEVYAFGGNQFGQLGTGGDQAETLPRLLDASSLENVHAKVLSCGARHSAIITVSTWLKMKARYSAGAGTSMASLDWEMRLTVTFLPK